MGQLVFPSGRVYKYGRMDDYVKRLLQDAFGRANGSYEKFREDKAVLETVTGWNLIGAINFEVNACHHTGQSEMEIVYILIERGQSVEVRPPHKWKCDRCRREMRK